MNAYVNSVTGNDSNDGLTAETAKRTLNAAVDTLRDDGTVYIFAPEDEPLREALYYDDEFKLTLQSMIEGQAWHLYGSELVDLTVRASASGQRFVALPNNSFVPGTVDPASGLFVSYNAAIEPLSRNFAVEDSGTPIVSAEVAARNFGIMNDGAGLIIVDTAVVRGAKIDGVRLGSSRGDAEGKIVVNQSIASFNGGSGFATSGVYATMEIFDSKAFRNGNDGFNHHGTLTEQVMTVVDSIGSWNGDEGISPHDETVLHIEGGTFSFNGSGGFTAIDTSYTEIDGATFANNNQAKSRGNQGGISFRQESTGVLTDILSTDNNGPDIYSDGLNGGSAVRFNLEDKTIYVFGSLADDVLRWDGDGIILAGTGDDIVGSLRGDHAIEGRAGTDILIGGFGVDTIEGGNGNDVIKGDVSTFLGEGDVLSGGSGDDLLEGGVGADVFVFRTDDGNDTIGTIDVNFGRPGASTVTGQDFESGVDQIELGASFGFADADAAFAAVTDQNGTAVFEASGTTITFEGLTRTDLSADDFILA